MTTTMLGDYILRSEFEYALKIMKANKTSGSYNINTGLVQYAGTKTKQLFKLIHDIYNILHRECSKRLLQKHTSTITKKSKGRSM